MNPFLLITGVATSVACANGDAAARRVALAWAADTARAEAQLLADLGSPRTANLDLGRPSAVRAQGGVVFVADVSNDRIAVLDTNATVIRWIGSRGRGPGELYGASRMAAHSDRVLVAEALNGRVSEFRSDGTFLRTYPSPFAAGALAAVPGTTLTAARSNTHYASLLTERAEPALALRRPRMSREERAARWSMVPGHDLIAIDSQHIWVFDQGSGALCRFAQPARAARCMELPATLRERMRTYRDQRVTAFEESTRMRVTAAPLAKDLITAGRHLALLLPLPELPLILIDPRDAEVTPVTIMGTTSPAWVRSATAFTWDGRGFVLVGDDGIGRIILSSRLDGGG